MTRALFLLIVSFISITTYGQKPFKYAGRGIQMTEMWADSVARIPSDTVRNKTGIVRIGVRFFVGNGTFWTEIAGDSSAYIDSLRRLAGSVNVEARKGGVWITQFTDSVGSGGGSSQNLDQVLTVGNNTDTTINFVDTLSTGQGKIFTTIYPRGYNQSGYPNGRPAMFNGLGYGYYPGVNADGRPNVVGLLWGYNGGFNNKVIAGEPTWGVRAETWYQISGAANSEFHGVSPEFQPINGTGSRRLGTWYVRNSDGYSTFQSQGDQYNWYRGASDTTMFAVGSTGMVFGSKGVGSFTVRNTDSTNGSTTYAIGLNGATFSNTVSTGAQPLNTFSFLSPISVAPGTSYGSSSSYLGLVNTTVAVANKFGFSAISSGITTTNFGGLTIDGNTTGTITPLYGRNTSATGTVSSVMIGGNGSTAAWMLRDNSVGIDWRFYLKSGDADRQLKIGFGTSTYDSLMKFRGTDGKVSIRTSLNVGAAAYPVASAALEVTSTTQGFLPPRMTATQAGAISSPAEGLLVYVTNTDGTFTAKGLWGWDGAAWQKIALAENVVSNVSLTDSLNVLRDSLQVLRDSLAAYRAEDTVYTTSGIETVYNGDSTTIRLPYKSWVALLSQSGSSAPTAIVLQNDFDETFTFEYNADGQYRINGANNNFTADKTVLFTQNTAPSGVVNHFSAIYSTTNRILITTTNDLNVLKDEILDKYSIEIRVFY